MKIGIFIDNFFQTQTYKDPGVIAAALADLGHEVTIYCWQTDATQFQGRPIKKIAKSRSASAAYWSAEDVSAVLLYSWLSLRFSALLRALKNAQKKVVLKLDSDGHLIYPLRPTYLRTWGKDNSLGQSLKQVGRIIQWTILNKAVSRRRLAQLDLSDGAIIESPLALANLQASVKFWQRPELQPKIYFIPDPVGADVTQQPLASHKTNTIIAIGRWDDKQKNKAGLLTTLIQSQLTDWRLVIIGTGSIAIKEALLRSRPDLVPGTVATLEEVSHQNIYRYLQTSKIFLAPSNYESFNLAAAEALCCGCSLAGTPLESFYYFSQDGKFGSIASDFSPAAIQQALAAEIDKWNHQAYQPEAIAAFWKKELAAKKISQAIAALLQNL